MNIPGQVAMSKDLEQEAALINNRGCRQEKPAARGVDALCRRGWPRQHRHAGRLRHFRQLPGGLSCDEKAAVIRVLDRGPSIPPEQSENVFRPFYRLEDSRSTATGGSGLGLAIARQLADVNGWKIELLPREDCGTEARLTIP